MMKSDQSPWSSFRVLCGYYADCVTCSERPAEYLSLDDEHIRFKVLASEMSGWLDAERFEVGFDLIRDACFLFQKASRKSLHLELYIGYPCSVFESSPGRWTASPIFLVPVKDAEIIAGQYSLTPDFEKAQLNQNWLKNIPNRFNYGYNS